MCTSITLNSKDGAVITGRTNEFTSHYLSEAVWRPRGTKMPSWFLKKTGFYWKNKHSFISMGVKGIINNDYISGDGLNEKGLSVSLLYFHYHDYKELKKDEVKENNINIIYLPSYLLGNYSTIKEIKKNKKKLEDIFYWEKETPQAGQGMHIIIVDKSGESMVIEPENKKLNMKDNPLRVLTNSSPLEYHYENLRVYSHLTSKEIKPTELYRGLKNHKLLTQGNGLIGMPGDFTANSRFIRAAILSSLAEIQNTAEESVAVAFRILNTSDIVPGFTTNELSKEEFLKHKKIFSNPLILKGTKTTITDITDNTIVKDLKNLKFYYKTWDNQTLRFIDLKPLIKNNSNKTLRIPLSEDGTNKFQEVKI